MKTKYIDFINQQFDFPQAEFSLNGNNLEFHGLPLLEIIKKYGTPLKFTYLPKISQNIQRAKSLIGNAMAKNNYGGKYFYCYCTKSSHFSFILDQALKNDIHLETSSAIDIDIIKNLYNQGKINKDNYIICNGFKPTRYVNNIVSILPYLPNTIPVIDNDRELYQFLEKVNEPFNIGIRIASEEEPKFEFYTSRLGIGYKDIVPFYKNRIQMLEKVKVKMLHFFINTGINDTAYYWNELTKCLKVYAELKAICPELTALNIGGGFPIKTSLNFDYDYEYITNEIIAQIKAVCEEANVPEPDIFTEFGSFTVGEAAGALYSVRYQKQQNDREKWNMIDSSFMTTLPDSWAISKRFLMLPINKWEEEYERVFLGGITCDSDDYYNSEQHMNAIYLPKFEITDPLYIGFFHTGAYQETVGGFGGLQHCLIPCPKHIIIDKVDDEFEYKVFSEEQKPEDILKILGY